MEEKLIRHGPDAGTARRVLKSGPKWTGRVPWKGTSKLLSLVLLFGLLAVTFGTSSTVQGAYENAASDTLIDSANILRIVTTLQKDTGEVDPSYDYYKVLATIYDLTGRENDRFTALIILPVYAFVWDRSATGDHITWSDSVSSPSGRLEQIKALDHCEPAICNWAQETFTLWVKVPQNAGLFAYVYGREDWGCQFFCNPPYEIYWSFVSYVAGGADDFNGNSGSGVADAPDSGTGRDIPNSCMEPCTVGGMLYGWTGGSDTAVDSSDRYRVYHCQGCNGYVRLYVNGKNFDVCVEGWWGTTCSRNSGSTDELVDLLYDAGRGGWVTVRIETPQYDYGKYEVGYFSWPPE